MSLLYTSFVFVVCCCIFQHRALYLLLLGLGFSYMFVWGNPNGSVMIHSLTVIVLIGLVLSCSLLTISGFVSSNAHRHQYCYNSNSNCYKRVSSISLQRLYGNKKNSIDFCLLPEDSSLSATKYITKSQTRTLNSHTNAALRRIIVERR